MEVRMLKSIASKTYSYSVGSTIDLPKELAETFIKAGIAKAVVPEAEETTKTTRKGGKKKNADNSGGSKKAT